MKKILEVPHWGQYLDITADFWKGRSCGITSLAMILDYYGIKFDLAELIEQGVKIDNYNPAIGWKHQTIVDLAEKYGLSAHRTENETVENLVAALDADEPVIISIHKNWDPENGGHLAVINGYFETDGKIEGFYVCDPVGAPYKHKDQFIPIDKFNHGWKKRAIYVARKQ
jgi:ABC-type bacteriocin/lantibiotic exporter with double-glycine peptidase domain